MLYYTPEQYFLGSKNKLKEILEYHPQSIINKYKGDHIVVGLNRIGKSSFLKTHLSTFSIHNDLHFSWDQNDPIIIDKENINYFERSFIISEGKKHGKNVHALYFCCNSFMDWSHLFYYFTYLYSLKTISEQEREKIYYSFVKPKKTEGFSSIIELNKFIDEKNLCEIANLYLF
jgi:hypothetical protein